jgi:hypothetical protein
MGNLTLNQQICNGRQPKASAPVQNETAIIDFYSGVDPILTGNFAVASSFHALCAEDPRNYGYAITDLKSARNVPKMVAFRVEDKM